MWRQHIALSSAVWRRVRRFGLFLLLGYALHFPVHRIADIRWLNNDDWRAALQVDILQVIGASLLLLQGLVFLTRTPKRFAAVALTASTVVVLATVYVWAADWPRCLPATLAAYLNGSTGSLFPLFPWSAYVLLGAGLGMLYASSQTASPLRFGRGVVLLGAALAVSGQLLQNLGLRLYAALDFWHTSPTLFATRAGVILLALGLALHVKGFPVRGSGTVRALAQQSLMVYFVHVCVLYGSTWNPGLRQYWGGSFDLPHAATAAALMIAFLLTTVFAWSRCKKVGGLRELAMRVSAVRPKDRPRLRFITDVEHRAAEGIHAVARLSPLTQRAGQATSGTSQ